MGGCSHPPVRAKGLAMLKGEEREGVLVKFQVQRERKQSRDGTVEAFSSFSTSVLSLRRPLLLFQEATYVSAPSPHAHLRRGWYTTGRGEGLELTFLDRPPCLLPLRSRSKTVSPSDRQPLFLSKYVGPLPLLLLVPSGVCADLVLSFLLALPCPCRIIVFSRAFAKSSLDTSPLLSPAYPPFTLPLRLLFNQTSINSYQQCPSEPRKSALPESTESDTELPSVRPSRRWRSGSTVPTPATSAARSVHVSSPL
jgi:hypothetical protein